MHRDLKEILITHEQIVERCESLAQEIAADYGEKLPMLVSLLKGSVPFLAELIKHIDVDVTVDYMAVSSYEGTESTGKIKIKKEIDDSVVDRDILIVEDIVDTGYTMQAVTKLLKDRGARSVKIVSLLDKPSRREVDITPDYIGFEVPNYFVVGFGLDYEQKYRNLPYIGILKEEVYNA